MPFYGRQLDDAQIAAVLTYMRNGWGAAAASVRPANVVRVRSVQHLRQD